MKERWIVFVAFGVIAGGVALTGGRIATELGDARGSLEEARRHRSVMDRRVNAIRAQATKLEREAALVAGTKPTVDQKGQTTSGPDAAAEERREKERQKLRESLESWQADMRRPASQAAQLEQLKERHREMYGPFRRTLGLSEEVVAKFDAAYAKRDARQLDLHAAMQELGLDPNDAAIAKLRGEIFRDHADEVRAALGESGHRALQDYERTSAARNVVRSMAATATMADTPMTAAQLDQVIALIASESADYARGQGVTVENVNWLAVREKLPQVLSAPQVAAISAGDEGLFHAWWNGELVRATKAGKK